MVYFRPISRSYPRPAPSFVLNFLSLLSCKRYEFLFVFLFALCFHFILLLFFSFLSFSLSDIFSQAQPLSLLLSCSLFLYSLVLLVLSPLSSGTVSRLAVRYYFTDSAFLVVVFFSSFFCFLSAGKPILIASWPGSDPSLPSILLNSHYDVVPADADKWSHPPFEAYMDDKTGDIFARGAQDMKCVTMQVLFTIMMKS